MAPLSLKSALAVGVLALGMAQCGTVEETGLLDSTFGTNGKVTTDFGGEDDSVAAVAEGSGGRIYAVGYATISGVKHLALARYLSDGTLDAVFGGDGLVTHDFGMESEAMAVISDGEGRAIVAGHRYTSTTSDLVLLRYDASGVLDTSFDSDGIAILSVASSRVYAGALLQQANGLILVGGGVASSTAPSFLVARYATDGTLDTSFGSSGLATPVMSADEQRVKMLVIDSNGRIIAGGYGRVGPLGDFAIARFSAGGALDTSFGVSGKRLIDFSDGFSTSDDSPSLLILDDEDGVLAVGSAFNSVTRQIAFAKLDESGALDASFGTAGRSLTPVTRNGSTFSSDIRTAVLDSRDRLFVAGGTDFGSGTNFSATRFGEDYVLQTSFGNEGTATFTIASGGDVARAARLVSGQVVLAGESSRGEAGLDFALLRLR